MAFEKEAEHAMHVDMTPLVDAIFAIILFLLVASSYVEAIEQDISINLPTSSPIKGPNVPVRPITVNVRLLPGGNAFYHVENERMSLTTLTINLTQARIRNKEQSVVIRADKDVKWDHVAKVLESCANARITKVSATFAVSE
jgi:biopolymer transport protein ExbD